MEPLAIVGLAFNLPQGIVDETSLIEVLDNRKTTSAPWPKSRANVDALLDDGVPRQNTLITNRGNFLEQDPFAFDAPFFSMSPNEAASLDPQARLMLETAYHAFENAGMPANTLRGSSTAVIGASNTSDFRNLLVKDPDTFPRLAGLCLEAWSIPNRLSWYFGLKGPSFHVDTACSSSLTALDIACNTIHSQNASAALVFGSSLMLSPETSMIASNLGVLSPDGYSYSFDARANGYSRGEGVVAVVVKPLSSALENGDVIRAVIRATASNQDGRTPILTQPNPEAQEALIRQAYAKAGLDFGDTRYFEAHGTGTATGDPIEVKSIGRVFRVHRTPEEPLFIGAFKSNIGHLEATSGLAGLVKAVLTLERGIISPNASFEQLNPAIDAEFFNLHFPTTSVVWPVAGLRRASLAAFGVGGSNSHVILDDAMNYLANNGLIGLHNCTVNPGTPRATTLDEVDEKYVSERNSNGHSLKSHILPTNPTTAVMTNGATEIVRNGSSDSTPKVIATSDIENELGNQMKSEHSNVHSSNLHNGTHHLQTNGGTNGSLVPELGRSAQVLVWTAADIHSIMRMIESHEQFYRASISSNSDLLQRYSYTLGNRRTHLMWRSFAVVDCHGHPPKQTKESSSSQQLQISKPMRTSNQNLNLAFVFTGQGAQYVSMGLGLLCYPAFQQAIAQADAAFASLGCKWSIYDIIQDEAINLPEYSQPICTALQIALVDLLDSFGISPVAAIGHSSGEIAAAYAVGALSLEACCRVAYYRGIVAAKVKASMVLQPGAMMSVNLAEGDIASYLDKITPVLASEDGNIYVACINSPFNCTLSGPETLLDKIKEQLDKDSIFAQKVRTGVPYHSPSMQNAALEYLDLLKKEGPLTTGNKNDSQVVMISSVTGDAIKCHKMLANPKYWVDNLVSPVRFVDAITKLGDISSIKIGSESITDILEIGPHSALRRSVLDTIELAAKTKLTSTNITEDTGTILSLVRYNSVLQRSKSDTSTILTLIGVLFCHGYPVSLSAANRLEKSANDAHLVPLVNCPSYPFNHTRTYFAEPRLSMGFRMRQDTKGHLLGRRSHDWNPLHPTYRTWLSSESIPWLGDHVISGSMILPGTGMIVMTLEAVKNLLPPDRLISGFLIKEANFLQPVPVAEDKTKATEVSLSIQPIGKANEKEVSWFKACLMIYREHRWLECFRADIQVQYQEDPSTIPIDHGQEKQLETEALLCIENKAQETCKLDLGSEVFYKLHEEHGIAFGPTFQLLHDLRWDGNQTSIGKIKVVPPYLDAGSSPVHPATLDATLHVVLAQLSQGLTTNISTLVPQKIQNAWISNHVWGTGAEPDFVRVVSTVVEDNVMLSTHTACVFSATNDVLCNWGKVTMVPVSRAESEDFKNLGAGQSQDSNLLYRMEWLPQLSQLSTSDLQEFCCTTSKVSDSFSPASGSKIRGAKLRDALYKAARLAVSEIADVDLRKLHTAQHLQKFAHCLQYYYSGKELCTREQVLALLDECDAENPAWKLVTTAARNLQAIICGKVDSLELLFAPELLEKFYLDIFEDLCNPQLYTFIRLASHEKPGLRILEIGAGTGSFTRTMFHIIQTLESQTGSAHFIEYTYSDISISFFEAARAKFATFADRMAFKKLNIEQDPNQQGFENGTYDMVIAGSVIHATSNLSKVLSNIRLLIRPGGHLIFSETTQPDNVIANVGFGAFEGWWLAEEEWRQNSPLATEDRWHIITQELGFSGIDLHFQGEYMDLMITTAIDHDRGDYTLQSSTQSQNGSAIATEHDQSIFVVFDPYSEAQRGLATMLVASLNAQARSISEVKDRAWTNKDILISLIDLSQTYLSNMDETTFTMVKLVLQSAQKILWVSAPRLDQPQADPHHGLAKGLLRVLRTEDPSKQIVLLSIESCRRSETWTLQKYREHILYTFRASFAGSDVLLENEYAVRNGHISVGRIIHESVLEEERRCRMGPSVQIEPCASSTPLVLDVKTPGMLDTLYFREDIQANNPLGMDEVEIQSTIWPLAFRDVFVALGKFAGEELGTDCVGTVRRVGANVTHLRQGDPVCLIQPGCMRLYPRAPSQLVFKLPSSISLPEVAASLNPGITAYHSLINIAQLQPNEKILIHSAAGATGQLAVSIAQYIGAEVYATVGSEEKKQFLISNFGIPSNHIFYSRNTSFAKGVKRLAKDGVHVILNSLAGESLRASWDCIAPYGRFIEIGKMDILDNSMLPMSLFAKNVSFCAVDLHHIIKTDLKLTAKLVSVVIDFLHRGKISAPAPLNLYPLSKVENALRSIQSGRNIGRVMISVDHNEVISKFIQKRDTWKFKPDATYLVAGAFGGLGRAILEWLADKGAKYVIALSRSGPLSPAAREVVQNLEQRGVCIMTPRCDVASEEQLLTTLRECASMPPIRGCINSAMVLQDAIFEGMEYSQWETTINSKLRSSWNLHTHLPNDLDFFILLSSLAGIYGSLAQGNYAAGCTFQDDLARFRTSNHCGKISISLDLGWMLDVGIIYEREDYQRNRDNARDMNPVTCKNFLAILSHYCDPALETISSQDHSQLLVGAITPVEIQARKIEVAAMKHLPMFTGFSIASTIAGDFGPGGAQNSQETPSFLFQQAEGRKQRAAIVVEALLERIARALYMPKEDINPSKALSEYGVDSLMAVELRNWIRRDFQAAVAVFDIVGEGRSITEVGQLVTEKSEIQA